MTQAAPPPAPERPLSGAEARLDRTTLFTLAIVAMYLWFGAGVGAEVTHPLSEIKITVTLFRWSFPVRVSWLCCVGGVYSATLAARAIWLPDRRLRVATRNFWLMAGGVVAVLIVRYILAVITQR